MPLKAIIDPNTKRSVLVPVDEADLGQDTAEEHAAKMAAPKPKALAERIAILETKLAALEAKAGK